MVCTKLLPKECARQNARMPIQWRQISNGTARGHFCQGTKPMESKDIENEDK